MCSATFSLASQRKEWHIVVVTHIIKCAITQYNDLQHVLKWAKNVFLLTIFANQFRSFRSLVCSPEECPAAVAADAAVVGVMDLVVGRGLVAHLTYKMEIKNRHKSLTGSSRDFELFLSPFLLSFTLFCKVLSQNHWPSPSKTVTPFMDNSKDIFDEWSNLSYMYAEGVTILSTY